MENGKLVSIVTPSYNCSSTLQETADSIINQTHGHWEWLITDDCSDLNTRKLLFKLSELDSRIHVVLSGQNSGAAVARNNSISRAKGDFIAFIDSDDIWLPTKLEEQLDFMGNEVNFSFTAYQIIDEKGMPTSKYVDVNQSGAFTYQDMLKKQATLGCSTVMLRRRAFEDIQMPLLRTGQDYALWLKLLKTGAQASILAKPLTQYRIMPNSISRNKVKKALRQWQIYREVEQLSLIRSVYYFSHYAWRAVFRR